MLVLYVRLHLRFLSGGAIWIPDLIDQTSHSDDRTISIVKIYMPTSLEKLFHDGVALTERKCRLQSSCHTPFIHQSQDAGGTLGGSVVCRSARRRLLPHHHRQRRGGALLLFLLRPHLQVLDAATGGVARTIFDAHERPAHAVALPQPSSFVALDRHRLFVKPFLGPISLSCPRPLSASLHFERIFSWPRLFAAS